ncbi:MAG: site-2 protease family protein [Planctomycetota bacterium]
MLSSATGVFAIILGFGFLILVHELGHFLVAKWAKIRATQFAIGFGQALIAYRKGIGFRVGTTEPEYFKRAQDHLNQTPPQDEADSAESSPAKAPKDDKLAQERQALAAAAKLYAAADELGLGETEYRLNWIPLGGYVKMLGQEDMDPNAQSPDPRAYNNKSIGARMAVISAGVVMNLIFALVFFVIAFMMGVDFPAANVGGVRDNSPAATTFADGKDGDLDYLGLRPGDQILTINGEPAADFGEVRVAIALGRSDNPAKISVQRHGYDAPLNYTLKPKRDRVEKILQAGIVPGVTRTLGFIDEASPWYQAGVRPDMDLTHVNGTPVENWSHITHLIDRSHGKPLTLRFTPANGEPVEVSSAPMPAFIAQPDGPANLLGLTPAMRVERVVEGSGAEEAGVKDGDILVRVGDQSWPDDIQDIIDAVNAADGEDLPVTVLRDGQIVELADPIDPDRNGFLGVVLGSVLDRPLIAQALPGSPFANAFSSPLPNGSTLTAINGQPIADWSQLQAALQTITEAGELTAAFQLNLANRPEETVTVTLTDEHLAALAVARWSLDLSAAQAGFAPDNTRLQASNPWAATLLGVDRTKQFILQTYLTLARLIQGELRISNLSGPVGIVHRGSAVAQRGFPYLLFFLGLISVNLAVLNFLPIPIVDGGHMVFLAYEKLRGKPASPTVQTVALFIGLALIGFVFLATFFYDLRRLFGL